MHRCRFECVTHSRSPRSHCDWIKEAGIAALIPILLKFRDITVLISGVFLIVTMKGRPISTRMRVRFLHSCNRESAWVWTERDPLFLDDMWRWTGSVSSKHPSLIVQILFMDQNSRRIQDKLKNGLSIIGCIMRGAVWFVTISFFQWPPHYGVDWHTVVLRH